MNGEVVLLSQQEKEVRRSLRNRLACDLLLARLLQNHRDQLEIEPRVIDYEYNPPADRITPLPVPLYNNEKIRPTIKLIAQVAAEFYRVPLDEIFSERRTKDAVIARQTCMYLCGTMTLRSLPAIGRAMGGRHHTTIRHAVQKIAANIKKDERLADEIEVIKLHIQSHLLNNPVRWGAECTPTQLKNSNELSPLRA